MKVQFCEYRNLTNNEMCPSNTDNLIHSTVSVTHKTTDYPAALSYQHADACLPLPTSAPPWLRQLISLAPPDLRITVTAIIPLILLDYHQLWRNSTQSSNLVTVAISTAKMSQQDAIRSEEATQSPPSQNSSTVELKARRRARRYKAACFYFAWSQNEILHKYAIMHASEADQTRWHELVAPFNARISDWIMLFLVKSNTKTPSCKRSSTD